MIKVLVNGAQGRMGKEAVKAISNDAALTVVGEIDYQDDLATAIAQYQPQVVVDFTAASAGFANTQTILNAGACPVIGTSGFVEEQVKQLQALSKEKQLGGLIAPNFSVGAVLMMKFAAEAAKYLPDVEVIEAHSPQKEESPSGTGLRTAEMISAARTASPMTTSDKELIEGARGAELEGVKLHSIRLPGVVAQQTVFFGGLSETLKIEHNSQHRESFMPGVVLACKKVVERTELVYGLEHLMD
ncbi:4-hydroxy-tetrahydrodipicolinate reductase [Psychrobium sp. 1_MG-2023]|uniref:4-hydroxy-tetrahydrodipicolinate reductase n=1 Tax=Psychrobium sp. 1_MG-2023 TaxID=3062624 RepID=UPI000C31BBDF|nr:4-hydroxy-tetrahydrodipicolinate reductase [Psychrobium sp. 1_MG-2023]MDP2562616.1 4-hydroxy-tetrahydrodipicolinate reductase [Psychrobium sp. 1_MG-2023]PKF54373.1 4-hydroxy-tetrahydrodipicolinate reductase [Alteromonadales bacterium alter-6D02]